MINMNDEQAVAVASVAALRAREYFPQSMNMELVEVSAGYALLKMSVEEFMLNGHASCHGGMIFSLADTAFAYACNSRNRNTVGQACSINYTASAMQGDVLFAEAKEAFSAGRTGVYDVNVTNQDGKLIAIFRGNSYRIKGELIEV